MTPELKKLIMDRYQGWAEVWGLSLAFAVTQSLEKAERAIADAIVALIAAETTAEAQASRAQYSLPKGESSGKSLKLPVSVNAVRFAAVLWELSDRQAFRGFGGDTFFKLPAIARAIVTLKIKARFSRVQIAAALHLQMKQVDDHLENARLLFSGGSS